MVFINPRIFRAYDIRGKAIAGNLDSVDLSPESVYLITKGIVCYMRSKLHLNVDKALKVVIGMDCRLTSESLRAAALSALTEMNCETVSMGLATSPLVYYATCRGDFDLGLVITASHNHKDDNGIKIVGKNAHSICGDEIQEILKIVLSGDFGVYHCEGSVKEIDFFDDYCDYVISLVGTANFKGLRVAVDTGNGVVGKFIGPLLRKAGCEVVELYTELDGNYPNHEANPEYEENLVDLERVVVEQGCAVGFGFDGDGDRVGVINEKGKMHSADEIIILLARDVLKRKKGAKIVFDVKCSAVLENEIIKNGGIPLVERTGHSFIEERMRAEGAELAGEVSGHIFIADGYFGYDDAMFACLKILKIFASSGANAFSDLLSDLPKIYATPEIKVPCFEEKKQEVMREVINYFTANYKTSTIDGVKIYFTDTEWGLIRPSNTSAYLTLRFEAADEKALIEYQVLVANYLKKFESLDVSFANKYI